MIIHLVIYCLTASPFNHSIESLNFPQCPKPFCLKLCEGKEKTKLKLNYRPITILPNLPKTYDWVNFTQMIKFFEINFLNLLMIPNRAQKWTHDIVNSEILIVKSVSGLHMSLDLTNLLIIILWFNKSF